MVSGTRGFLPAPLAVIALGAAAGLVWYGAMRTIPVYDEEGYDDYEDEPATGYEEQGYAPASRPEPVPAPTPPPDQRRGELRFPEPSSEELRFPENTSIPVPAQPAYPESPASNPAGPTAVDGIGNALDQSPLAGLARPGALGGELANACGQITVYTLLDGRESAFDRLAADLVKAALAAEPETLIFASHEVVGAPTQRIFYQLFRDEAAFAAHRRQPHLQRFLAESRTHVIATNVIELKLGAAKVPLPAPEFPGR
ncbi:putative quinol monooxygenase [Actinomadura madurae]|uniref:putative quinol monooxygenase n=1 Tax=Actinomadura madurae TaxID=1993 RepID=UPI0020D24922|nr:antibiotic biosynthesis monooxygenase [Actinomadura madurae]MCP9982060.1 antibiotic biosynthesis monooxygenase [Actinomadura madurae]